jgi:integrase
VQCKRNFVKKSDAQQFLLGIESGKLEGNYVAPARGRVLFGAYAEQWLAGRVRLKPKTVASYRSLLDRQVLPRWGNVRLDRIAYEDVAAWVAHLSNQRSASTTRKAYHLLTSVLNQAVKGRRLVLNPAAGVELPRLPNVHKRYLTHQQVAVLADACGPESTTVLVLAYTGIRWGELAAVRVSRVDPGVRRIHVAESMTEVNGRAVFGSPKTHADRWVAVPRFLRDQVAALTAGKAPSDLLFTSPRGTVNRVNGFRRRCFDQAATELGLPGLTPHELRHTAASLAVSAGATVKGVQSMLGHASAAMTLDRYSHLFDDELDAVADRLDQARDAAGVPPVRPGVVVVAMPPRQQAR